MARWRDRILTFVALGIAVAIALASALRWRPDTLGPRGDAGAPPALGEDELRVLTLNAWLLSERHRVDPLVAAIDAEGAALASGDGARPALVGLQELRSREVIRVLGEELRDDGFFAACECSRRLDGSLRSAVAAAVRHPYVVRRHECVGLARIAPDERRCAIALRVEDPEGRPITFVVTHLAWHFANGPMAAYLREQLEQRGALGPTTILVGDFNAWPGTEGYAVLDRAPLRDARPDAPPTHFLGRKLDHVLIGDAFEVVRGLDRRASFERVRPGASTWLPSACDEEGPPECPVSDHLPEGVVLRWRQPVARSARPSR